MHKQTHKKTIPRYIISKLQKIKDKEKKKKNPGKSQRKNRDFLRQKKKKKLKRFVVRAPALQEIFKEVISKLF